MLKFELIKYERKKELQRVIVVLVSTLSPFPLTALGKTLVEVPCTNILIP